MDIAGGVYVEKCVTPETTQLLGSAGRAALALSAQRGDIVLHTFHPPHLWDDILVNFKPFGVNCALYPSTARVTFSYLFPLGRPVQTPIHVHSATEPIVEGSEILSFGCVEGRFIVRGNAVVYDPQGDLWPGFRAGGSAAKRLALILNAQEILAMTGGATVKEAAITLIRKEDASVAVVKDGPRGATVIDAQGQELWIPPYHSSRLYKIGSGDVFSATFAHSWLSGADPAEAADQASRQTAEYVESPVLPLPTPDRSRARRSVTPIDTVLLVAEVNSFSGQWLVAVIAEALFHLGIEDIRDVRFTDWLANDTMLAHSQEIVTLICVTEQRRIPFLKQRIDASSARHVVFVDDPNFPTDNLGHTTAFSDLGQALYELFWQAA